MYSAIRARRAKNLSGAFKLPVPQWQHPFLVASRQARLFFGEFVFELELKI
jgi:hypothetical protein